jgi:hypothetical protein
MTHRATARFSACYRRLPKEVQHQADCDYQLLHADSRHPSLHLKKVGDFWSARVGLHYRVLGIEDGPDIVWAWIGTHAEYDRLLQARGQLIAESDGAFTAWPATSQQPRQRAAESTFARSSARAGAGSPRPGSSGFPRFTIHGLPPVATFIRPWPMASSK